MIEDTTVSIINLMFRLYYTGVVIYFLCFLDIKINMYICICIYVYMYVYMQLRETSNFKLYTHVFHHSFFYKWLYHLCTLLKFNYSNYRSLEKTENNLTKEAVKKKKRNKEKNRKKKLKDICSKIYQAQIMNINSHK